METYYMKVSKLPLLLFSILAVALSGCSILEYKEQSETVHTAGVIQGEVKVTSKQIGQVMVLRFQDDNGILTLVDKAPLSEQGRYEFVTLPGKYSIAAFIDINSDGVYQQGEHGNFHEQPLHFIVTARETTYVPVITISGPPPKLSSGQVSKEDLVPVTKNIGRVVSLDDAMFSAENYSIGTWRPVDFLQNVGGGLLMLQPYQKNKIPFVFIHGINSGPTDWRPLINQIDQKRYQPWVMYYPSGVRLDSISSYLAEAMAELDNRYKFKKFKVAAHSMGGLVARSFIKKYVELYPAKAKKCDFFMTVNSPLDGMPSAVSGVKHSPIVVASWRDVASGSQFLNELHDWHWPKHIPYYLIFSYQPGEDGDGIVALENQIPLNIQLEAKNIYGFNSDHSNILFDDQFIDLFNSLTSGMK